MSKVICICGKICSGKSYYARNIKEQNNAVILSTDEATFDLTNNEQGEFYNIFADRMNKYLRKKAVEIVKAGANVILDWGFWTRNGRKEISDFFKDNGVQYEWHYINVDDKTWYMNIKERNKKIDEGNVGSDFYLDEGLMNKLVSRWEEPIEDEMNVVYTLNRN